MTGWLNRANAARYLDIAPKTLTNWANLGHGPKFTSSAGRAHYRVTDLDAFMEAGLPE